jgi:hypothetical protein
VSVAGNYAYVVAENDGLWVVSISDPAHPFTVGHCDMPGIAWDVATAGDYAYVADLNCFLRVVSVADPARASD